MKTKLERFALGLILAPLSPLAGFLGCWWASYVLLPERWISFFTIGGLLLGFLADIFILKRLIARAYQMRTIFWVAVFLFYTIGFFGFFMGVPVLNTALAIPAGFVVGGRLAHEGAGRARLRVVTLKTSIFTTAILSVIYAASAFMALVSSSTSSDLQGMLNLGFVVSPAMIWGLILVGGAGLLLVNWVLTVLSVHLTYRFLNTPPLFG